MSKKLTVEQQIQEEQYSKPYHYFIDPFTKTGNFYFSYIEKCIEIVRLFDNKKILDAGCGDGYFISRLDDKKNKLYGIDYSQRAIDFAKLFNEGRGTKFTIGYLEKTPFPNEYFDIVTCIAVLEHIKPKNIPIVIQEMHRVLKKDGLLILAIPTIRLKKPKKHFQHFALSQIKNIISPLFELKDVSGRYNLFYDYLLKLFENRFYELKIFSKPLKKILFYKLFASSPLFLARMWICKLTKN